jgi:gas vesicle protein
MKKKLVKNNYNNSGLLNGLIGALAGGLVGISVALLFAPQSGKRTRAQIQEKSIELRDQTTETVKKVVAQVRSGTEKITTEVKEKAEELKQLGQDKLVEQLDRVSTALDAGKKAVEAA